MSKTLIFLQENKLTSKDELNDKADVAVKRFHELQETIKAAEKRMAEISELRTQIVQYAKTHDVYAAYRKAGYSKRFRAEHEAEILLHQADSRVEAATKRFHKLQETIKAIEKRMAEISELRTQIVHYAKTREVYAAYRKAGYSKKFRAEHEAEILLHQAAKEFFDKQGIKKLPKVKELNAEYTELLKQKKVAYPEYRKAREEMQRLLRAQKNIERFFADETPQPDRQQSR